MESNELKKLLLDELESIEGNGIRNSLEKGGIPVISQKLMEYNRNRKMAMMRIYLMIISFIVLLLNGPFQFLGSFFLGCIVGLLIGLMFLLIRSMLTSGITKDRQILILELLIKLNE